MAVQKKIKKDGAHQFAFYVFNLVNCFQSKKIIEIRDIDLVHRIVRVLRLSVADKVVLFDREQHIHVEIIDIDKRQVLLSIIEQNKNIMLQPSIIYLLPLLKKDALQDAVYSLVEVGVTRIQLVVTAKSRQSITGKEFERLQKAAIAAAEQSKHYTIPEITVAEKLLDLVPTISQDQHNIVFDLHGESFFQVRNVTKDSTVCLLVGPEGGLTKDELHDLQYYNFVSCMLTPTVLRAVQAVPLSAALFRLR